MGRGTAHAARLFIGIEGGNGWRAVRVLLQPALWEYNGSFPVDRI